VPALPSRRDVFAVPAALAAAPLYASAPKPLDGFGKAKSVVVLYLYGAPSQMDTLDPKPDAPVERRGEFGTVATVLPGIRACEHLPRVASVLNRVCLVRSMSHTSNNHAVSVALSGLSKSLPVIEANKADAQHQPYFGSVLEYLWARAGATDPNGLPANVILPWPLNARTDPNRWSPHAAWLGSAYNPVFPLFRGAGALEAGFPTANGPTPVRGRFDPYDAVTPDSTFAFEGSELPADVTGVRFAERLNLIGARGATGEGAERFARYQRAAARMIADPRLARAVDVTREPLKVREKYGLTLFGMEALAARRLIEAGVRVVTAFWDDYSFSNNAWDTHYNQFPRLKEGLCPIFDRVLPAFLDDMEQRGLLRDTLVMVVSEHGRTPELARANGGGRDHWAGAYWGMFFGAGVRTGQVIGATDKQGAFPTARPIDPKDVLATAYHLLGVDAARATIPDRANRPMHLLPHGEVVREMLA